jgi:predicted ATPase
VTVQVRIHGVWLETTGGTVEYQFSSDLTVLAGPTGVGKTTLLELIKYGFGCHGKLAPCGARKYDLGRDLRSRNSAGW